MTMQSINFGNFEPDLPDIVTPGTSIAKNCLPHQNSYLQWLAIATDSNALDAYCRGAVSFSDSAGNSEMFAGNESKLYRLATATWTSVGGATYDCEDESYWRFAKWGEKVIATNFDDEIQIRNFGASGTFGNLGGSPPKARHIGIVRGFVVLGDVTDGTHYSNRVQWSGLENETSWGTVPATQADFQDLYGDGGRVMAVAGGDVGIIFQERAIWEMEYIGAPMIFRFTNTAVGMGTPAARSVVRYGNSVFFYSQDGFMRYDLGGGLTAIGDKKIDQFFKARATVLQRYRMVGYVDVPNAKVIWSYATGGGDPTELIVYDWKTDNWSYIEVNHEIIFDGRSVGYTLDGLDSVNTSVDALPASLDADMWKGGQLALYVFATDHKSGTFGGAALTARIETGEIASGEKEYVYCDGVRPVVAGGSATNTVYIATRNNLNEDITYSSGVTASAIGDHNFRSTSRYMRFRVDIAGGFDEAIGVQANIETKGRR